MLTLLMIAAVAAAAPQARAAGPDDLARLSRGIEELAARIRPAVVQVMTSGYAPTGAEATLTKQRGTGSGVILDAAGYVMTNAHVVAGARRIQVTLAGPPAEPSPAGSVLKGRGQTLGAQVVGVDEETDLAVLKVGADGLPALALGDSEALRQGQLVLAFGSPLGLENSVTLGVVSAVARQLRPEDPMIYVQTDASINPGNSGGPLVDLEGRVVGINTLILTQSGGSEGLGFAAPSNIVRNVFEQLRAAGRVRRGSIGARTQSVTPTLAAALGLPRDWGVVVSDVAPGGPAAAAGLAVGDVVTSLDGKPMENARQLEVNLYRRRVGESLTIEVLRGERGRAPLVVSVVERERDPERLAAMVSPERNSVPRLGVLALDLDDRIRAALPPLRARTGAVVAAAAPEGVGGMDPLRAGDVIYAVNGELVSGVDRLREIVSRLASAAPVALQVERDGQLRYVAFEID